MKKIEAIVRMEKVDAVSQALSEAGIKGLTLSHVTGRGRQRTLVHSGRASARTPSNMLQRAKIEVFIPAEDAERACEIIRETAATGQVGDGKIFVLPVESAMRIRTGETGTEAL